MALAWSPSASLDLPETSDRSPLFSPDPAQEAPPPHSLPPHSLTSNLSESFRHSGWSAIRDRVYRALHRTSQSVSRILSFESCGFRAWVYRSREHPDQYRVAGSACHDRFCVPCARERAQVITANISERLDGQAARFLTLTLKTDNLSLRQAIDKLQRAFRILIRTTFWLSRVDGGIAFVETKYNLDAQRWHPHVHAILHGRYIPQDMLAALWERITGDSSIVHLQIVRSRSSILHYVTTYCSKSHRSVDFPTVATLDEAIVALRGRRLCRTFGTWRGLQVTQTPVTGTWELVGSLEDVLANAVRGDVKARGVLSSIGTRAATQFLMSHPARPPPPTLMKENDADPSWTLFSLSNLCY